MNAEKLIITVFAEDRPGILQKLSDTVLEHQGNWMESSLSRLCGQFVGIVCLEVSPQNKPGLLESLTGLSAQGIEVTIRDKGDGASDKAEPRIVELVVEANDRPGIIEEIAAALAANDINIEQLESTCESASMAGYQLFIAQMLVALPDSIDADQLEAVLENVSDDLIVSIIEDN